MIKLYHEVLDDSSTKKTSKRGCMGTNLRDYVDRGYHIVDELPPHARDFSRVRLHGISLGLIKSNQQLQFNQPISNVLFPNEHIISVGNTATAIPSGTEIKLYGIRA